MNSLACLRSLALAAILALTVLVPCAPAAMAAEVAAGPAADEQGVTDRIMRAIDLLGTPYRPRGSSPDAGFDCSGFIGHLFRVANAIDLPRSAREMYALAASRAASVNRDAIEPGDLLFFSIGRLGKRIDHVAMYLGDNRFVHAPASGGEVRIDTLALPYWQRHFAGARRVAGIAIDKAGVSSPGDNASADAGSDRLASLPAVTGITSGVTQ